MGVEEATKPCRVFVSYLVREQAEASSAKITDYDSRSTGNGLLDTGSTPVYSITPRSDDPARGEKIAVFKNVFGIILDISGVDTGQKSTGDDFLSYAGIQKRIEDHSGVKVSKSSISRAKKKCNVSAIGFKAGEEPKAGIIKTEREKLILEAFRALGVIG